MQLKMSCEEYRKLVSKRERSKSKYNNHKVVLDGIKFDSQAEANRYCELKLLLRANKIQSLCRQVKFLLVSKSKTERAMYYLADFVYTENRTNSSGRRKRNENKSLHKQT